MPQVHELLEELHHLWPAQGCTIAQDLAPGSSVQELDTAEADLGFTLSEEVRDWYGWRSGLVYPVPTGTRLPKWPPGRSPGYLTAAVRHYHQSRQSAAELTQENPQPHIVFDYGAAWLTLTRPGQEVLVADNQSATTADRLPPACTKSTSKTYPGGTP